MPELTGGRAIEYIFERLVFQRKRVLTTQQLANIFGTDIQTIRENYRRNSDKFGEGKDYFILAGLNLDKFRAKYKEADFPENKKRVFLWTKSGALIHIQLLSVKKPYRLDKSMLDKYYSRSADAPGDELVLAGDITGQFKEVWHDVEEMKKVSQETLNIVKKLEAKLDTDITRDCLKASDIAHKLCLHSRSGLPHSSMIGAIAKKLDMKIENKCFYQDDDIIIANDISKDINHWQVYYKPAAVEKIKDWFEINKNTIKFELLYKRDGANGKKGEVKERGYKICGVNYKVKL